MIPPLRRVLPNRESRGSTSVKVSGTARTGRAVSARSASLVAVILLFGAAAHGQGSRKDPIVGDATSGRAFVLAEFVSATCPACDEMRPIVDAVLSRHPEVGHQIHDADIEVELAKKYRVRCVPVYVVVDPNGEVKFNDVGILTESELEEILHRSGLGAH
jgi:thiol-disulfide isomerase/thioredoxin